MIGRFAEEPQDSPSVILYEYPFNERIRTYLRLEHLFRRLGELVPRSHPIDHHYALATIFEVMDVAARADLKSDVMKDLEAIIHPLVGQEIQRQVDAALAAGARCIVFDIPLLVESGRWRAQLDRVLVVDCEPGTQVARVTARSALTPEQVRAIIAAQAPRALRLAAADLVICNEGITLEALRSEVEQAARTFGL
jgi:hypothetical protein